MAKIIKSAIGMIALAFTSLILITGSPFQTANNLVENNGHLYIKNLGQEAYAADEDGGGDDGGGDDGGGDDGGGDDGGGDDGSSNDDADGGDDSGADDGDGNGDSGGDVASFGEDSDDGSDGNGSDEGTSTSDDSGNNMVEENNDGPENYANIENSDVANVIDGIEKDKDTGYQNPDTITISDEAEGSISQEDNARIAIEHAQQHGAQIEAEEKKSCEANDGKYKDGKCKFKDGDDSDAAGSFDHDLEEKGLYDNYAQRNADDSSEENPNNKDSDGDGIYDDEELSKDEEKRLAESAKEQEEQDEKWASESYDDEDEKDDYDENPYNDSDMVEGGD